MNTAKLRAIAEAATPGPWFTNRQGWSTVYVEARIGGGVIQEIAACGPTKGGSSEQEANAALIATFHPARVKALLDCVEALQAVINADDSQSLEQADIESGRAALKALEAA